MEQELDVKQENTHIVELEKQEYGQEQINKNEHEQEQE